MKDFVVASIHLEMNRRVDRGRTQCIHTLPRIFIDRIERKITNGSTAHLK